MTRWHSCRLLPEDSMHSEIRFVEGAIHPKEIAKLIAGQSENTGLGAHALFAGQVRADVHDNGSIRYIDFSAYIPMAEKVFRDVCRNTNAKFKVRDIHILHSTGKVNAGEICFVAMVSGIHRQDAFDALRFVVEEVKARVPVFGKEAGESEMVRWKQNT